MSTKIMLVIVILVIIQPTLKENSEVYEKTYIGIEIKNIYIYKK